MKDFIYIDNSNLFIEGQRFSAVSRQMVGSINESVATGIQDHSFRIDLQYFKDWLTSDTGTDIGRLLLYGSKTTGNNAVFQYAKTLGYETQFGWRNQQGKEKAVDMGLATEAFRDAAFRAKIDRDADTIVVVAGDGDFVPVVKMLVEEGFNVEVIYWSHASKRLQEVASKFIALDNHIEQLSQCDYQAA